MKQRAKSHIKLYLHQFGNFWLNLNNTLTFKGEKQLQIPGGRSITVSNPVRLVRPPDELLDCRECTSSGFAMVWRLELPRHCIYLKQNNLLFCNWTLKTSFVPLFSSLRTVFGILIWCNLLHIFRMTKRSWFSKNARIQRFRHFSALKKPQHTSLPHRDQPIHPKPVDCGPDAVCPFRCSNLDSH